MEKIGVIISTFLRDSCLESCVESILNNRPKQDFEIFIGDQNPNHEKGLKYSSTSYPFIYYYDLPYDCGLSYSRNYLIQRAKEHNCNYILLMADNIYFTAIYDFAPIIEFLKSDINIGMVGFDIDYYWMFDLEIINGEWNLFSVNRATKYQNITYFQYDIIPNFFLAKTQVLVDNPWDDRLKMTEHEDFFWRLKTESLYKAYWTKIIKAKRVVERTGEYKELRQRHLTEEFRSIVKQKWGLTGWIKNHI